MIIFSPFWSTLLLVVHLVLNTLELKKRERERTIFLFPSSSLIWMRLMWGRLELPPPPPVPTALKKDC